METYEGAVNYLQVRNSTYYVDKCPNCGYCRHCGRSNDSNRGLQSPFYTITTTTGGKIE